MLKNTCNYFKDKPKPLHSYAFSACMAPHSVLNLSLHLFRPEMSKRIAFKYSFWEKKNHTVNSEASLHKWLYFK